MALVEVVRVVSSFPPNLARNGYKSKHPPMKAAPSLSLSSVFLPCRSSAPRGWARGGGGGCWAWLPSRTHHWRIAFSPQSSPLTRTRAANTPSNGPSITS
ncbi:hypothetical protein PVL29_011224 [Vitis rotundifolia]|uniref:Uncharacterized protein n=1 Tax=Vitis rotundifolia TaxID=103349 RepID=A0AA38ZMX2_VITRO|nr:hypothetical protein PVL29_011224 [Vitis rotundifolia]